MLKLLKKPIFFVPLIVAVAAVGWFVTREEKVVPPDFVVASRQTVVQEVDVTGRVKPSQSVDLAFEKSGHVAQVYAHIGDRVAAGALLATLENLAIQGQLLQVQASLAAEEAELQRLIDGTRPEEIRIAEGNVTTAEQAFVDAKANRDRVNEQATADLENDYVVVRAPTQQAVSVAKSSLLVITDLQQLKFSGASVEEVGLANTKTQAALSLLGVSNAGRWDASSLSIQTGGAFNAVADAVLSSDKLATDEALQKTAAALQDMKTMLEAVPITTKLTDAEKTIIESEKSKLNTEISNVAAKTQAIATQKATNAGAITIAETAVANARNAHVSANDTLALKRAGTVQTQIDSQRARRDSARGTVQQYQAELAKTTIRSPLTGIVTAQKTEVGEIVAANTVVISVIADAAFEIETNIPEADIAIVALDDTAEITLDAYPRDVLFTATVVRIDPAETIIDGVATYTVTLQFAHADERIKSGMTANLLIATDKKEDVLAVPQRAIIRTGGENIVRILAPNGSIREEPVETGLRGTDGMIEILSGVREGDKIITFLRE